MQGANAYFAAGSSEGLGYGTHVYALNARTGAIVWQNNTSGSAHDPQDRTGTQPCGSMTIAANKLWLQSGPGRPGLYNLTTGAFDSLQGDLTGHNPRFTSVRGKEIGVLDGTHVIACGRYQFSDHGDRGYTISDRPLTPMDCIQIDVNGNPRYPQVELLVSGARAPAWDNTSFYTVTDGQQYLEKWNIAEVTSTVSASIDANQPAGYHMYVGAMRGMDGKATEFSKWRLTTDAEINAIALATNGVVVTRARKANNDDPQANWIWYLSILSRDAASVIWQTTLPSTPLQDGVAITRAGDIVVSLKSGAVMVYGTGTPVSVAHASADAEPSRSGTVVSSAGSQATAVPWTSRAQSGEVAPKATPGRSDTTQAAMSPMTGTRRAQDPVVPVQQTPSDSRRALSKSYPLADSIVTLTDGTRVPLQAVAQEQRTTVVRNSADMAWKSGLPRLTVVSARASSVSNKVNGAANTTDGLLTTRWSPSGIGDQWITYDLGCVREVSSAELVWFARVKACIPFTVETSLDGNAFGAVESGRLEGQGTNVTMRTFVCQQARYVRISLSIGAGQPVPGLYEVGIHAGWAEEQAFAR